MIKLGIENFVRSPDHFKGKKIGLITNAASVDGWFKSSVDLLRQHSNVNLVCLFGPQQGFFGETQDNMVEWASTVYPRHNLPLYSLYGEHRKPPPEMLSGIDAVVFDIQDIGCRVYTYIWTMVLAMKTAAECGKDFIVCDRPNPINGIAVEGNVSSPIFSSFVGLYPLPMRHGMTAGEIARYINSEFNIGCNLTVVSMDGWRRSMWFDETGIPWVLTSANMPTLDTASVYPATVIFEGTNISEGRGTTRPFEFIGAPFINGFDLADELARRRLPGVFFRPCVFIPTFQKHAGLKCGGVQLHVTDRKGFRPFDAGIVLLKTICDMYSSDFKWKEPPYEYVFDKPPIDVILGCDWIRSSIEGGRPAEEILKKAEKEAAEFSAIRKKYLIYS